MPPQCADPQAPDDRHERHAAFADILDHREVAALGVGIVAVDVAAENKAALVAIG